MLYYFQKLLFFDGIVLTGKFCVGVSLNIQSIYFQKLAITYIRELRDKKKEDPILICKICKDRTFTAAATLLYHYRSHAGIESSE